MDDFSAIPMLAENLQRKIQNGEARLATVVASYGGEVDAMLSDGSVARFASTHRNVPIGQGGVLIVGTGGKKIFTPMGVEFMTPSEVEDMIEAALPIPFSATTVTSSNSPVHSTTTIGGSMIHVTATPGSISVPAGTYAVHAIGIIPVKRSVATGSMWTAIRVGGSSGVMSPGSPGPLSTYGLGANEWFSSSTVIDGDTISTSGSVALSFGYLAQTTAGTTTIGSASMHGTLTRIG